MSDKKDHSNIVGIIITVAFVAAIIYVFAAGQTDKQQLKTETTTTVQNDISVGGPFTLRSHEGETVTDRSWPDQYLLIFFGFTNCPDVCPTELGKMKMAYERLPVHIQDKIQPLFITVDPERDDEETLANYIGLYNDDFLGLTGNREQINAVIKNYRVYAQAQDPDENGYYVVDHSAFTYLMKPDGVLADVYSHDVSAQGLSLGIRQFVR